MLSQKKKRFFVLLYYWNGKVIRYFTKGSFAKMITNAYVLLYYWNGKGNQFYSDVVFF